MQEDTARQQQWANVMNAIINTTQGQLSMNPQTGLIADFLKMDPNSKLYYPARGEVLESEHDGDWNWNSCRMYCGKEIIQDSLTCDCFYAI